MDKGGFGEPGQRGMPQESTNEVTKTRIMQTANMTADGENMPQMGEMPQGDMQPPGDFNGEMPDFEDMEIQTDENGNPVIQN